jgi:hypothetical protein
MYLTKNQKRDILLEESQSTPENPDLQKKRGYQKNTDDMERYSAKRNPNDCPNTPYGIMQ